MSAKNNQNIDFSALNIVKTMNVFDKAQTEELKHGISRLNTTN